jgi:hypothetical protein
MGDEKSEATFGIERGIFRRPLRKTIIGKRRGGEPQDEREHFIQCPPAVVGSTCAALMTF